MATAATAELISGVPKHAISCPCFSCRSSAVSAAPCVFSDRTPRLPAPRLGRIHCLQRWLGERISPSLFVGIRRLPARATGSAPSRHTRDAQGHPVAPQGGQGTQLQDSGALVHEQASTRSGAGLPSLAQSLGVCATKNAHRAFLPPELNKAPSGSIGTSY